VGNRKLGVTERTERVELAAELVVQTVRSPCRKDDMRLVLGLGWAKLEIEKSLGAHLRTSASHES
jgi:hypothetical protein